MKLCILINLKVLISNTAIVFFKFWPKSTQIRHFWSKVFYTRNFEFDKFEGFDLKFDSSILKFAPNFTQKDMFRTKLFSFCMKLWSFINSRVVILNMTIVFQILVQKYANKAILAPNLIAFFNKNFAFWESRRCCFKYDNSFFQIPVQKYPNKAILVLNVIVFL